VRRILFGLAVLVMAVTAPLAVAARLHDEELYADLSGAAEVPPGAENGKGTVEVTLNEDTGKVCWKFSGLSGLEGKPLLAHIHKAKAGKAGDVVVPLGERYKRSGCTTASKSLVKAILAHPGRYYVNVHNDEYPSGAVRGQLEASEE
jgi:CHRD domain